MVSGWVAAATSDVGEAAASDVGEAVAAAGRRERGLGACPIQRGVSSAWISQPFISSWAFSFLYAPIESFLSRPQNILSRS